jgi:hypothetical protein
MARAATEWAYSSVVEHYVDIVGVASSNLATPTIQKAGNPLRLSAFLLLSQELNTKIWIQPDEFAKYIKRDKA